MDFSASGLASANFNFKLERNWGKKEKTKSTWTKKEIGERSEQRVARGGELGGAN